MGLGIGGGSGGGGGAMIAGLGLLRSYHSFSTTRSRSSSHARSERSARDGALGGGSGEGIFCSHSIWRIRSRRLPRSSSDFCTRRRTSSCNEGLASFALYNVDMRRGISNGSKVEDVHSGDTP